MSNAVRQTYGITYSPDTLRILGIIVIALFVMDIVEWAAYVFGKKGD